MFGVFLLILSQTKVFEQIHLKAQPQLEASLNGLESYLGSAKLSHRN